MSQLPVLVLTPCEPDRPPDLDGPRGWTRVPSDGESHYDPGPGVPQPGDHPAYWRTWALWNASGGAIAAGIRDTVGQLNMFHRGVPPGLGEPVFDRLEADLAKAVLSLPATKGFEIGSGFAGSLMRGSEHNDHFYMEGERVRTRTNRSGGVQGGISNGETIFFRVAFKPTATIFQPQPTVSRQGEEIELKARGRHDACVLPRAVPMVEAMTVLVLTDHVLRQRAQNGGFNPTP